MNLAEILYPDNLLPGRALVGAFYNKAISLSIFFEMIKECKNITNPV